jgi:carboxymethylenebutenolidase
MIAKRITVGPGLGGYLAYPEGQRSPAVLVHFEIFGVNNHIEDVCRRLAGAGYAALAPDYYSRLEKKTALYADMNTAFGMAATLKDDQVMSDAGKAIRYLRSQTFIEAGAIATLGFCMGGRLSILTAASYQEFISAAISFYGGGLAGENRRGGQTLDPMEEAFKVQAPMLLFYGGKDQFITSEHVEKFTGRLQQLGKKFESHVYPEAGHGFFCNDRQSYRSDAAKDAWQKSLDFLEANLKRAEAAAR